jgi:hypothetical protein
VSAAVSSSFVENDITYLSFPDVADSIVVFGSGFARRAVRYVLSLQSKEVVYWGDIDTPGFDILSRLRNRLPTVRSILMDAEMLVAHSCRWVVEPTPTNRPLPFLNVEESSLYTDWSKTGMDPASARARTGELSPR